MNWFIEKSRIYLAVILRGGKAMMQDQGFTEKDWKLFRKKIVVWQEAYMDRLNKEYVELLSGEENPSTKFWRLEKRIWEDQKKAGVQVQMSRSKMIHNLIRLLEEGAISLEDLEGFSEELRERVKFAGGRK